uniref:Zinc finger protein RFP-like n=1 Tax=Anolis carolinensis TaxID=28377 RepID=G1KUV2_ANOCA|nr:PREDICTED: tripartite motif-containing protein 7 isoform X1 [Anolis carolinensis]|eukprot:XP_008103934.1 PREDICTED: tripartite motif-containing protein 7 isoform X1 [Anolis carolinensis]
MAAGGDAVRDLCEEATCPICLDFFQGPVIIPGCGHSFCRSCLSPSLSPSLAGGSEERSLCSCPQCRQAFQPGSLFPNRQLANLVEIAKKLRDQGNRGQGQGGACQKHQEPLKLFCKEDRSPICVVCDRAKEHREHTVIPLQEAAQEYQDVVSVQLKLLQVKREKILENIVDAEKEGQELFELTQTERQQTVARVQEIRQFLEEQEKLLLAQMDKVEEELARQKERNETRLSEELDSVNSIIWELEKKRQQPASELLKDVQSILQRSEEKAAIFQNPVTFSPELKLKIWDFCDINHFLKAGTEQFKKALLNGLPMKKANVSLDQDTAHPRLVLSEDCKSVGWGEKPQDLPKNLKRFDQRSFVLGCEGFTTGRHYWDVFVKGEGIWAVGVVRKSVRRKGPVEFSPEEGIWAVGKLNNNYRSIRPPENPVLRLRREPSRIRVTLNCTGERVAFFDADTGDFLYAFSAIPFSGETLHPYFCVIEKGQLRISS